ncbi:MAG: hypothetical protein JW782_08065, partial [Candidatus Saganbacteria bacterium]|nr:hypothetical protein [Candidatus Saganbacteria bacterium]
MRKPKSEILDPRPACRRAGSNRSRSRFIIITLFGFLISSFGFISGCSRTVTPLIDYGDQLLVEITLRGSYDVNYNKYFVVLSSGTFRIPLPPPDQLDAAPEFIEPGDTPIVGSQEAYYSNFFDTWSGYVVVDPGGYAVVRGPFVVGQTATREVIAMLGAAGNKLAFLLSLDRLFQT